MNESMVDTFLDWFQSTVLAETVGQSLLLTGFLSSVHLLGMTLVVGGALVASLRLLGILLPDRPVVTVTGPAGRGIMTGLAISVSTGLLLVAPRAFGAFENRFFRVKMLLLLGAVILHVTLFRSVTRQASQRPLILKITGACELALWAGVAVAGCAFILLE